MHTSPGWALIRTAKWWDVCLSLGITIADDADTAHKHIPNVGVVLIAPVACGYLGGDIGTMKESGASMRAIQQATGASALYDTDIEVKSGDMVLFRRLANVAEDAVFFEDDENRYVRVRYDNLLAIISGGGLTPLNGLVFVEDQRPGNISRVLAQGSPIRGILGMDGLPDTNDSLVGKLVVYNVKQAVTIENEMLGYVSGMSGKNILALHQRYIHATYEE